MLKQYELLEPNSGSRKTTWLEEDTRLKRGKMVTLKETGETLWVVAHVYDTRITPTDIKRGWNNNI